VPAFGPTSRSRSSSGLRSSPDHGLWPGPLRVVPTACVPRHPSSRN
jgi:hypothetical protein